jgi:hypothetical protein
MILVTVSYVSFSVLYNIRKNIKTYPRIYIQKKPLLSHQVMLLKKIAHDNARINSGGRKIGRPKKNKEVRIGRAGRIAIEAEDITRDSLRWQRRKKTIERFNRN